MRDKKIIKKIKIKEIFSLPKKDEVVMGITYPLQGWRLEPRAVSPNQSGVTTSPLDRVIVFLTCHQIF
jgi:hypothetical protein